MPEFTSYFSGLDDGALDDAAKIAVTDTAGHFVATDVEGVLAEIGDDFAPLANPTFTGNVVVPDANADGEAVNKGQVDTAIALIAPPLIAGAAAMSPTGGAPTLGSVGFRVPAWLLDASLVETIGGSVAIPSTWATADIVINWSNSGAGSGDVSIYGTFYNIAPGGSIAVAATAFSATLTAPAQDIYARSTIATAITVTAGNLGGFRVGRVGTDGGDTLTNDIGIMSVEFIRVS